MSHEDIALVWSVLYGREDINSILVEAVGSHSLDVSVHRGDPERLRRVIVQHVSNLKVIYDLQRNYLQSSPRKSTTSLSLLRRDVLLSSIVHLLDVTAVAFSVANGSPSPVGGSLYAQTLLSALRALSLQEGSMKENEHELLDRRFEETFKKRHLDDLNSFTINYVCRRIIKDLLLGTESRDVSNPACGVTTLPDFFCEPYVLELNSERITGAIRRALYTNPTAQGWLRGVLVLYDVVWSTTAALIRLCMITEERKRKGQWSLSDEASRLHDLQSLLSARFQVQNLIFTTPGPANLSEDERWADEQLKALLLSGLRLTCILDQCECLGKDRAPVEILRSQHSGKQTLMQMSIIASTCQIPPDYDLALKEMASDLDRRTLQVGKERHEIGRETSDTCSPFILPNAQLDNSQASVPGVRRKTETSPRPIVSTPFFNDMVVRRKPSAPLIQISRPAHAEGKRVETVVSPALSLEPIVVHHSRAEENINHQVSPTIVAEQPPAQPPQRLEPLRLGEEFPPVAVEPIPMLPRQPVVNHSVPLAYSSSDVEESQPPAFPVAGAGRKTTSPSAASDQSQSLPTLSHNFPGPFTGNADTVVRPTHVPLPLHEGQNGLQPAMNEGLTVERKQIDRSPSQEKMWVDPSKEGKSNEWQPPHIDFNTLLDLKRPNLVTDERKSSFVAPSYDEVLRIDKERSNSTAPRSPTLSSEGASSLPWTPHIERENYPELAPVQNNQTGRPSPRRIDTIDPDSFPEPLHTLQTRGTGAASIVSDESEPSRFVSTSATSKSKKWGGLFKSNRTAAATSIPQATFSACGKSLILWNEQGAGCYDLHNADSIQFRRINARDVRLAAGGAAHLAVVTKTGTGYRLEVFEGACDTPIRDWRLDSLPSAIAVSRNDYYIALKFSRFVYIYEIATGGTFYHELPALSGRSGRGNHLVTFATDSQSFMASTRYEPEKVITYWSECTNNSKAKSVETNAPFGLVGDDGLSSLVCSSTASRSACVTTFTEKGPPALLSYSPTRPTSRLLRDKNGIIGSRIHRAALCASGSNLVLMNQRNDVFWVFDCFGLNPDVRRIGSVKRPMSVKRDVEIAMPNSDEVYMFWIDKGRGYLVTMGRGGGKAKPVELTVDMELLVA